MAYQFKNFAISALAANLSVGGTTLTVVDGTKFPDGSGANEFLLTLWDGQNDPEIVLCSVRSGNDLTVTRAQESTAAFAWRTGTQVRLALTAAQMATAFSAGDPNSVDWSSMSNTKAEELAERLVVAGAGDVFTAALITANLADGTEAQTGSANDVLMTPLRSTNHFNFRTTAYTRNFLAADDQAEAIAALSLGDAALADFATEEQAQLATSETVVMSPKRTNDWWLFNTEPFGRGLVLTENPHGARIALELTAAATYNVADQSQAEAGTSDLVLMTPLKTTHHFEERTSSLARTFLAEVNAGGMRDTLELGSAAVMDAADQTEAEGGTASDVAMTPQRTQNFYEFRQASDLDMNVCTEDTEWASPAKTGRAIELFPARYRHFTENTEPSTPAAGTWVMWITSSGNLRFKGNDDVVHTVTDTV